MSGIEADNLDDLGEMDGIGAQPVPDFLPAPDQLVRREDTVKVTLALSRRSVDFFRGQARRQGVPYQRMIRALVDEYARRHG
jgi:predicted DNA binding CopG/RHH family protein